MQRERTMANDLTARKRSLGSTRQTYAASYLWKIGIPLLCGLTVLFVLSRQQGYTTGFVHSTTKAQVQVSNCTQPAPAGGNVSCNCPPISHVTDGADADGVLRSANKVSSTTVENILDAASTSEPAERTVRVRVSECLSLFMAVPIWRKHLSVQMRICALRTDMYDASQFMLLTS